MTGPEHYRKAEELLAVADDYEDDGAHQTARNRREEAQVHATLALAAATAFAPYRLGVNRAEWKAWASAAWTEESSDGR